MLFPADTTLAGDTVRLTLASVGYAPSILQAWKDSAIHDSWHHSRPRSIEEERAYIMEIGASPADHLFIVMRHDGRLIGTCGLHEFHGHVRSARIGFCVFCDDPCLETCVEETITLVREAAYARLDLRCVYAHILATDLATQLRLKQIGFIPATRPLTVRGHKGRERIAIYMEHQNPALLG